MISFLASGKNFSMRLNYVPLVVKCSSELNDICQILYQDIHLKYRISIFIEKWKIDTFKQVRTPLKPKDNIELFIKG